MRKQRIDATIDQEIWFYLKRKEVNVSQLINDLLKLRMEVDVNNQDLDEITQKLEEAEEQVKKATEERDRTYIQLIQIKQQEEENALKKKKEDEERLIKLKNTVQSIQRSRRWQDV